MKDKRANKKNEKAERHWQRIINLAQATAVGGAPTSPDASICCLPSSLVAFASSTGGASANSTPLFSVSVDGSSSAISDRPLSLVAGSGP